jgi:hypothetical protein
MFRRKLIAPDGKTWTVRPRLLRGAVGASRQGAYYYSGGISWRESRRELERITGAIESGELDAALGDAGD